MRCIERTHLGTIGFSLLLAPPLLELQLSGVHDSAGDLIDLNDILIAEAESSEGILLAKYIFHRHSLWYTVDLFDLLQFNLQLFLPTVSVVRNIWRSNCISKGST